MTDLNTLLRNADPASQAKVLELLKQYNDISLREKARGSFIDFVRYMWPSFIEGPHHRLIAKKFDRIISGDLKRLMIFMAPRHCYIVDTEVLTTSGWKTIGTVEVGDYVYGVDGKPTMVVGKSPVYKDREIFSATTTDGHTIYTDEFHNWTVRWGGNSRKWEVQTSGYIADRLGAKDLRNKPILPKPEPFQGTSRDLLVHPWVLGAWLGDGASRCGRMSCHPKDQPFIRSKFESFGYETTDIAAPNAFGTKGLHTQLSELGVIDNKHIPAEYMTASVEQRMALIQGLMDTDGSVGKNGKCVFNQTDLALMEQFVELIHGMGLKARITSRETSYNGKPSRTSYRTSFKMANACSLPRKKERCRDATGNTRRTIDISRTNCVGSVQCIEIDRPDGLFLVGRHMVVGMNTKSEFASYMLPAYALGKDPTRKIIQASNTGELAVGFGRKVRNLVGSDIYSKVFQDTFLSEDSKAAHRWNTNHGGEYFAVGTHGKVTGRGADLLIIDDPHSEQEAALNSANIYNNAYEWYKAGPRQRLQPGGAIVIVVTRWSKIDLPGQILKRSINSEDADRWEIVELPAILDEYTENERPVWPGFWPLEELQKVRGTINVSQWQAQYQQNPTSEEGAIIKREWWKEWTKDSPPHCEYVIQSWDTAFSAKESADFSACSTWGVFRNDEGQNNLILLDAVQKRLEFPELKQLALEKYREFNPDSVIVEQKASGTPLTYELRRMGVPVSGYTPTRGSRAISNDKVSRVNAISDIFSSGFVWAPPKRWAEEVIEQCAEFPFGESDDLVDTVAMVCLRFRQGGFLSLDSDESWDQEHSRRRVAAYY